MSQYPNPQYGMAYNQNPPQVYQPPPPQAYQPPPPQQSQVQKSDIKVVVNQPQKDINQNNLMVGTLKGTRNWSTGLCDCLTDVSSCLFTMCCYSCAVCRLAHRSGDCFATPFFVPLTELILRTRIRTLGDIRGSLVNDCVIVLCCPACAVCQMARELDNMGVK